MRLRITFAAVLLSVASALSAATAEIDQAAAALAGKEASFTQSFSAKGFKTAQVEKGSVLFGALPRMRWTYASPEQKQFVFDGSRSWFFVPADRQVTVADVDTKKKRELPFLLIGDPAARGNSFTLSEKKQGALIASTLTSRDAKALIRAVTITTTAADHLVRKIEYSDREGNRTVFEFSGYHPAATPAEAFRFSPPAGVDVVQAQ